MMRRIELNGAGRAMLLIAPVLAAIAVTVLMPVLPIIDRYFSAEGDAGPMVRSLISSVGLAMIVGSLASGVLADHFGVRPVILVSLGLYVVAGVAGTVLDELPALVVSRVLVGLAAAIINTLVFGLIASAFTGAAQAKWMGWASAAGTIGSLIVVPAAGFLGNFGWRLVFLLHLAAVPVILLAIMGIRASTPVNSAGAEEPSAIPAEGLTIQIFTLFLLAAATGAVINAVPMFLPFHLAAHGNGAPSVIAIAMLASTTTGALVCLGYGWVRRWLSADRVCVAAFAIGGAGLAVVALSFDYLQVVVGLAITGAGLGLAIPNLNATAALIAPPSRQSSVIGLVNSAFYVGGPLAQIGLDSFSSGQSAAASIMMLATLSGFLCVIWLIFGRWQTKPATASGLDAGALSDVTLPAAGRR